MIDLGLFVRFLIGKRLRAGNKPVDETAAVGYGFVLGGVIRGGGTAVGLVVGSLPAAPHAENRGIGLIDDVGRRGDAGVLARVALQLADGQHQRHAGVGAGFRLGIRLAGVAKRHGREAQQPNGKHRQKDHQRKRSH